MRRAVLYAFGLTVTVLVAVGLLILSSAGEQSGLKFHHDAYFFMKRQMIYLALGIVIAIVLAMFDYRNFREYPWMTILGYIVVFVLLLVVFRYDAVKGSRRWIPLGFVRLQPSELAKIMVVIATSVWLDRIRWRVDQFWKGAVIPGAIICGLVVPVLLEPDYGSVMVMGLAGALVMFVAGTRVLYLGVGCVAGAAAVVYDILQNPNRMRRIIGFIGEWSRPIFESLGANLSDIGEAAVAKLDAAEYQANMALVAMKNGGVFGVGLNESMQKELYLPEAHTDFIFAIGAEEFGLCFSLGVMLLFVLFFTFAVLIARKATDAFGRFLVIGLAFLIFFQTLFNLGVVSKALPTKGVALPFFSYGGTNMISAFICVGIIMSVGIHSYREANRTTLRKVKLCR